MILLITYEEITPKINIIQNNKIEILPNAIKTKLRINTIISIITTILSKVFITSFYREIYLERLNAVRL